MLKVDPKTTKDGSNGEDLNVRDHKGGVEVVEPIDIDSPKWEGTGSDDGEVWRGAQLEPDFDMGFWDLLEHSASALPFVTPSSENWSAPEDRKWAAHIIIHDGTQDEYNPNQYLSSGDGIPTEEYGPHGSERWYIETPRLFHALQARGDLPNGKTLYPPWVVLTDTSSSLGSNVDACWMSLVHRAHGVLGFRGWGD